MNLKLQHAQIGHAGHPPLLELDSWFMEAGGLHVVLGSNGSGKSTLLRSILGIQPLLSGSVALEAGSRNWGAEDRANWVKHLAFVPSTPPQQVGLTVREVLELSGDANDAARLNPRLESWFNHRLSQLSDGQTQQVMVARAMLQSPHWVVLDEPTAFLDVAAQRDMWSMLSRHVDAGGSVLMATHDLRGVQRGLASVAQGVRSKSSISLLRNRAIQSIPVGASLEELELELERALGG
ncbi:MAG: ABC transporter ATP-binding protein [Bacteroidetes bacterium]|nr:ABC transporter ATP-binding protein [Bacteroidota bacterium]